MLSVPCTVRATGMRDRQATWVWLVMRMLNSIGVMLCRLVTPGIAALVLLSACSRSSESTPKPSLSSLPQPSPPSAPKVVPAAPSARAPNAQPWGKLLELGRIFANPDATEVCEDSERPHVLVVLDAPPALNALALEAGCRELEGTSDADSPGPFPGKPLCCPPGLTAAPPVATGGAKSCARALIDHVATSTSDPSSGSGPSVDRHGSLLKYGTFLEDCGVPRTTLSVICVAVNQRKAEGVSVVTSPFEPTAAACVAKKMRELVFPLGDSMDVTITRFPREDN